MRMMENRVKVTDEGIVVESNSGIIRADGAKEVFLDGDFIIDSESVGRLLATIQGGCAASIYSPHLYNSQTKWYTSDADLQELADIQKKSTLEADRLVETTLAFSSKIKTRYKWGVVIMITATLLNLISFIFRIL